LPRRPACPDLLPAGVPARKSAISTPIRQCG
jgi:hypothetical protein